MFEAIEQSIRHALETNQFLSGGLILGLITAAVALLPKLGRSFLKLAERQLVVHAEIRNPTVIDWLDQYLQESSYGRRCRALKVEIDHPPDSTSPLPVLAPGIGAHVLRHGGRFFHLDRSMDSGPGDKGDDALAQLLKRDVIHLRTLGRDRRALEGLIDAARQHHIRRHEGDERSLIYINVYRREWTPVRVGQSRPLDSVVLADGLIDDMLAGIRRFRGAQRWYEDKGIPYRYGFSLEGPPGSGKSSIAKAIAGELGMRLHVLDLNAAYLNDLDVMMLMANLPLNSMVLVEDIDCDGLDRDASERGEGASQVTLKGVLNAFDGVTAGAGRVLVITTNHPERLDKALIRPGRIDDRYHLGPATVGQATKMFRRFFPDCDGHADRFAENLPADVSMAAVQGHLIRHSLGAADARAAAAAEVIVGPVGEP